MSNPALLTDAALFRACVALDRAAQGEFTRRFRADIGRWIRQTAWRRGCGLATADVEDLAEDDEVTGPGGAPWGPTNFIVNCPIIQRVD